MRRFIQHYKNIFPLFEKNGFKNPVFYKDPMQQPITELLMTVDDIGSAETFVDRYNRLITQLYIFLHPVKISFLPAPLPFESVKLTADLSSQELSEFFRYGFAQNCGWLFFKHIKDSMVMEVQTQPTIVANAVGKWVAKL